MVWSTCTVQDCSLILFAEVCLAVGCQISRTFQHLSLKNFVFHVYCLFPVTITSQFFPFQELNPWFSVILVHTKSPLARALSQMNPVPSHIIVSGNQIWNFLHHHLHIRSHFPTGFSVPSAALLMFIVYHRRSTVLALDNVVNNTSPSFGPKVC